MPPHAPSPQPPRARLVETGEFWTARQRQAATLHEVSYRACFKPQLPAWFITRHTNPGDLVHDPFAGRGTTAIEAALHGRRVATSDINPLSRILTEPRLELPPLAAIRARLDELAPLFSAGKHSPSPQPAGHLSPAGRREKGGRRPDAPLSLSSLSSLPAVREDGDEDSPPAPDLTMFYAPRTLRDILALRAYLHERRATATEDAADRWLRMVATNRLTGHSPGFFSVYTLPPNQAASPKRQLEINRQRNQTPPERDILALIWKKTRQLHAGLTPAQITNLRAAALTAQYFTAPAGDTGAQRSARVPRADESRPESRQNSPSGNDAGRAMPACETRALPGNSVALTVTSPPFLDTVQYAADNWLRCWFNHIDTAAIARQITITRTLEAWDAFIRPVFAELHRVTRPGGRVAFEVGEIRKGTIRLEETAVPAAEAAGFVCEKILINEQTFTKTANIWGVTNNTRGTNTNRIALLRKT